jgi:hypothetical protein
MTTQRIALTPEQKRVSDKINRYIELAKKSWEDNNNSRGAIEDKSDDYYLIAEKTAQTMINIVSDINPDFILNNVLFDCGVGLYPTFEMDYTYKGEKKHYTAYNTDQFFKTINGFWN